MYVNQWTVDYGPRGRQAVQTLLDRGYAAGLIPERVHGRVRGVIDLGSVSSRPSFRDIP